MHGVAVSTLTGENGVITKAIEAAFRSEMAEMRDNVDLVLINCEMYGETVDEKFEQVKFEDAKKWDEYLKLEVIYYGEYDLDYGVTKLSRDYIKSYGDSILESNTEEIDGTKYVRNLYIVDKETANGKEKIYIYDKRVDQVYKVPLTSIGPYRVHSVKELDYQKEHGTGERDAAKGTLIEQETSTIVKVGNTSYYGPELKGFVQEKTSALYYKTNQDGTLNENEETLPITTYLSTKERTTVKNSIEYEFFNYENQIWANIKVEGNGIDTYWTWIPRYAYKFEGAETKVIYIDTQNKQASNGEDLPEGYIVHTAFIENNKKGIWASKYEVEQVANQVAGDFPHYLPDMKGFNRETTYVEVMNENGTFTETKLSKINNLAEFAKKNRWFDYENQIWANIKTVSYGGAETWWVWIPRYAYNISGNTTSIIFVDVNNKPLSGETLGSNYIVHPAFEGGKKGIWASKYEIGQEAVNEPTTNDVNFPDLSGFAPETTWIELYKDDGTFEEKKLSEIGNIQEYAEQHRWYDYSKQIWANIKTEVDGAECWWVWIPRYAYNITGIESTIIFLDETGQPRDESTLPSNYVPHSAFEGKKGIWASKYEVGNISNN